MGPSALTHYLREMAILEQAKPVDYFYPTNYHQAALLRDPGLRLRDLATSRTRIIHLWNELQRKIDQPPPPGSPLHELIASLEH